MLGDFLSDGTRNSWLQQAHRWARKASGWSNRALIKARMHKVRPPMSAVFDTDVSQLCKVERGAWYSTGEQEWAGKTIETGHYGPMESPFPEHQKAELPFINAICEMARRGQMELYSIPSVDHEKSKRPDRHTDQLGCVNIDHGIKFKDLGFQCAKMSYSLDKFRGFPFPTEQEGCSISIGRHGQMLKQFAGKRQQKDALHLMICDSFGVEFFFTADEKFLNRHKQVSDKLKAWGLRTLVIKPSEFCRRLGIRGIPIAPTDPMGIFRGTIR